MPESSETTPAWVDGELRLAGQLDARMVDLLKAIDATGSINQAAKQVGLSYKGAWQIVERANNGAPKALVNTATGGSKGGGTRLTEAGRDLVALFERLAQQHRQFLTRLNEELGADPDTRLLLQRLAVKTGTANQLFGTVAQIDSGAVNATVAIALKDGQRATVSLSLAALAELNLHAGSETVLLLNHSDIGLAKDGEQRRFAGVNCLPCQLLRSRRNDVGVDVWLSLQGGEVLRSWLMQDQWDALAVKEGERLWAYFNSQAPIVGAML